MSVTKKATGYITTVGNVATPPQQPDDYGSLVLMPETYGPLSAGDAIEGNLYLVKAGVFSALPASAKVTIAFPEGNPGVTVTHQGQGQLRVEAGASLSSGTVRFEATVELP